MRKRIRPDQPPADLRHCDTCGKVVGTAETRGYFGAECQCGTAAGSALDGAPSVGTQRTDLDANRD